MTETIMTHTTIGALGPEHAGRRVRITPPNSKMSHEGIAEDIGHYLDQGLSSVRFEGVSVAFFAPHNWHVEVEYTVDEANGTGDPLLNIAAAYDHAFLAIQAEGVKWAKVRPERLARVVVESAFASITQALADDLEGLAAALRVEGASVDETDAYSEVVGWLRDLAPTDKLVRKTEMGEATPNDNTTSAP